MPRRSAASLEVARVAPIPGQRPAAPAELSAEEVAVWSAVVATKPADWFLPDVFPLLAAYCKAVVNWRRFSDELARVPTETVRDPDGLKYVARLTQVVEKQARLMTDLATRMRMTPQSRWQPKTAATKQEQANPSSPWQKVA